MGGMRRRAYITAPQRLAASSIAPSVPAAASRCPPRCRARRRTGRAGGRAHAVKPNMPQMAAPRQQRGARAA
jgi:hypothetical protein